MSIRLLVVDDHPVVSQGLTAVLHDYPDLEVSATAATTEEALLAVERLQPDVLLLDLELRGRDGQDLLPHLLRLSPRTRVLIFTAYDSDERVFGALQAGAHGYLLKGAPVADIVAGIRRVHGGESYLEGRIASRVLARLRSPRSAISLTQRQREVLRLVAQGRSNQQIADALRLSERTVKFHLNSIFNKLGADNRAQAVAVASQRGML